MGQTSVERTPDGAIREPATDANPFGKDSSFDRMVEWMANYDGGGDLSSGTVLWDIAAIKGSPDALTAIKQTALIRAEAIGINIEIVDNGSRTRVGTPIWPI